MQKFSDHSISGKAWPAGSDSKTGSPSYSAVIFGRNQRRELHDAVGIGGKRGEIDLCAHCVAPRDPIVFVSEGNASDFDALLPRQFGAFRMAQSVWRPAIDSGLVAASVDRFAVGVDTVAIANARCLLGVATIASALGVDAVSVATSVEAPTPSSCPRASNPAA